MPSVLSETQDSTLPPCMQVRASEIEAQLTETQDKLQKLQEQKAQLEARNALLEKVSNLCMKPLKTPLADQVSQPSIPFNLCTYHDFPAEA